MEHLSFDMVGRRERQISKHGILPKISSIKVCCLGKGLGDKEESSVGTYQQTREVTKKVNYTPIFLIKIDARTLNQIQAK